MSYVFNPFTSNLDYTSGGVSTWLDPVANFAALPAGAQDGSGCVALDTHEIFVYNQTASEWELRGALTLGTFDNTSTAKGLSFTIQDALTLHAADATNPGAVSTISQTFAGDKTFNDAVVVSSFSTAGIVHNSNAGLLSSSLIVDADVSATALINRGKLANGTHNSIPFNNNAGTLTDDAFLIYDGSTMRLKLQDNYGGLHVEGRAGGEASLALQPDSVSDGSAGQWILYTNGSNLNNQNDFAFYSSELGSSVFILQSSTGNLGVGTNNPTHTIDVTGTGNISGAVSLGSTLTVTGLASTGIVHADNSGLLSSSLIVNADISGSAAIAYSKLNLTNSIVNADVNSSAAIAYSKLALTNSIVNADIASAAAIAVNKLAALTPNTAVATDGSGFLLSSSTTTTELGYVHGVTSAIQTQLNGKPNASAGDLNETSFSAANNQSAATNVTGLTFINATVRSFEAIVSVYVNATSSLYEQYRLNGIQRGADWQMSATSVGDASGFTFSVTTTGQVQYVNSNYTGFVAATVKFRAITTTV